MFRYPVISAFIGSGLNLIFLSSIILLSWVRFFSSAQTEEQEEDSGIDDAPEIRSNPRNPELSGATRRGGGSQQRIRDREAIKDLKKEQLELDEEEVKKDFETGEDSDLSLIHI